MAINAQWIPIISEGISWVSNQFGPSKKELIVKVSDLEQQVQSLVAENVRLTSNMNLIVQAILNQLQASNNFIINADSICLVGKNTGIINTEKSFAIAPTNFKGISQGDRKEEKLDVSKIFDGVDEEIAHTRITQPSNKKQKISDS